ncbi:hypothetical protein O6H91_06G040800 [Diphasiastrum complanatum]|uniref:Uncharacterized protein n=1 Tax=Diphasiastrum complanatum TaxID=34168 RepID=A0ACC2DCR8_DIPCM|nr:hypothetical protein O6H91_06G040800 [Diphasiastrum complanatum]
MHKSTSAKMGIGVKLERCFSVVLVMVLCEYFFYCGRAGYEPCTVKKGFPKLYNCRGKFNDGNGRIADVRSLSSPTRYMIKLKNHVSSETVDEICLKAERATAYAGYCIHKYKKVWLGMLIVMEGEQLLKLLNKEANVVDHVEVEGTFRISNNVTEVNPPWGLDRIDRLPGQGFLNNLFKVASAGNGVHVYVVDTVLELSISGKTFHGIRCTHQEFWYQDGSVDNKGKRLSRCLMGFDAIGDGLGTADCNGHGTHCAGIIAGLKSGVAKNAFIHPIRAMSCDGSGNYGSILASLEWIGENAILPAVVSMSIATKASISIDQMVDNLVNNYGVVAVAASGNFLQDACNYSPSRANSVISVGSSNVANTMSWFSNYGNCTTIFAPGELIASSYNGSDTDFATLSGTSMACPHVAGAAALYLGLNVDASPSEVRQIILDSSEPNAIGNVKPSTTTKLLNVNMKDPIVDIHPRSIYNGSEGVTYSISISLKTRPSFNVFLTPYLVNTRIGYFQPVQIVFNTGSSWSTAQTIKIVFVKFSDFLDQTSVIQWLFTSQDPRFALSPAGVIVSHDTDVCQKTSTNSCGQTANTPKVIPSLPFYYVEDSNLYENVYDSSFDKCHSSGPDVVFQYTAPSDMIISASLCGDDSQFDTMLSIYEKRVLSSGATVLNQVACNDDYCNIQSSLSNVSLLKGHVYVFMVDGYEGDGGLFDFHVIRPTEAPISNLVSGKIATSTVLHKTTSIIHEACTSWTSRSCSTAPRVAIPNTNDSYFWKVVSWGPCDKTCGGGKQDFELCNYNISFGCSFAHSISGLLMCETQ